MTLKKISLPKQCSPREDRRSTATYNFVPLPEAVIPAVDSPKNLPDHGEFAAGRCSGYFDVTLTTKTPLYIRSSLTLDEFHRQEGPEQRNLPYQERVKNKARFFHVNRPGNETELETPVIPGSSLRGMVRNLIEIATFSKIQWVKNDRLVYRAVGDTSSLGEMYRKTMLGPNLSRSRNDVEVEYPVPNLKGGYLKRTVDGWAIQPAKTFFGESFVHVEYHQASPIIGGHGRQRVHQVFVSPARRTASNRGRRGRGDLTLRLALATNVSATSGPGLEPATLVESGHMGGGGHPKHWHCAIFEPDNAASLIQIPEDLWDSYSADRDMTRGIPTRKLQNDGEPLFFLIGNKGKLVFFGPTMMFRFPYPQSPLDFIPPSLRNPEEIDFAEAMFGFVRGKQQTQEVTQGDKSQSYFGRIVFTDAVIAGDVPNYFQNVDTPKILSTPKPTSFQHYLVQSNEDRNSLKHYSHGVQETVIRGHKLYWHQGRNPRWRVDTPAPNNSTQHTRINPVSQGISFKFRINFENLTKIEVGALAWALQPKGEEGRTYCHKLGMGKPLGLGSVHLDATLRLIDRESRYRSLFAAEEWDSGECDGNLSDFQKDFEDFILAALSLEPNGFSRIPRISALLKMMEWNDRADPEVRTPSLDEFKKRKVLPPPIDNSLTELQNSPSSRNIPVFRQESRTEPGPPISTRPKNPPDPTPPITMNDLIVQTEKSKIKAQSGQKTIEGTLKGQVSGSGKAKVETEFGELTCEKFPNYGIFEIGLRIKLKITLKDGKPVGDATFVSKA